MISDWIRRELSAVRTHDIQTTDLLSIHSRTKPDKTNHWPNTRTKKGHFSAEYRTYQTSKIDACDTRCKMQAID